MVLIPVNLPDGFRLDRQTDTLGVTRPWKMAEENRRVEAHGMSPSWKKSPRQKYKNFREKITMFSRPHFQLPIRLTRLLFRLNELRLLTRKASLISLEKDAQPETQNIAIHRPKRKCGVTPARNNKGCRQQLLRGAIDNRTKYC